MSKKYLFLVLKFIDLIIKFKFNILNFIFTTNVYLLKINAEKNLNKKIGSKKILNFFQVQITYY